VFLEFENFKDSLKPTPLPGFSLIGVDSARVESISSYIDRVAVLCSTTPSRFKRVVAPELLGRTGKAKATWFIGKNTLGCRSTTSQAIDCMQRLTGQSDLARGTFDWLLPAVSLANWTSDESRFCSDCLAEDLHQGRAPYERLLWRIASVSCCDIHFRNLQTYQKCHRTPTNTSRFRFQMFGVCSACNSYGYTCQPKLGISSDENNRQFSLQWGQALANPPPASLDVRVLLRESVRRVIAHLGSISALSKTTGINHNTLSTWLLYGHRIHIRAIERISDAFNIPILQLFSPGGQPISETPKLHKKLKLRPKIDINKRRVMIKAVSCPNRTLAEVQRETGLSRVGLRKIDEDLFERLLARNELLRCNRFEWAVNCALNETASIIEALIARGQALNRNSINIVGGGKWHYSSLRREIAGVLLSRLTGQLIIQPRTTPLTSFEPSIEDAVSRLRTKLQRR
jgi:transcriptional regulator with XRE-family HTH domain